MILRLLRARIRPGAEARLRRFIRDEAMSRALRVPGLVSFQPGLRFTTTAHELIIVSTWNGFDDVAAAGPNLDGPLGMPGSEEMLEDSHAEHHELVIGEARSMPLHEGKLQLTRFPLRDGHEASYFKAVRGWSDRLLDETGMVAFSLGRRVVGRQDEIIAVQVWQDEAAMVEAASAGLAEFRAAEPVIEHFDALTATEPHADAPAILLADDDRRFVHATPAAERLSGRSLARLLTARVEDVARPADREAVPEAWTRFVARGSMHGPYILERPDGSEVDVRYIAKANAPWPGSHASLLVPADDDAAAGDPDIDEALADAGLVARYAPAV